MEIRIELCGRERKELAKAAGVIIGAESVYMRAPSYAYQVGWAAVSREGALVFDESTDAGAVRGLLAELARQGFVSEDALVLEDPATDAPAVEPPAGDGSDADAPTDGSSVKDELAVDAPDRLVIEVPLEGFTDTALSNLEKLVASKAALIMKSIGADALPIEREDDRLRFPWFTLGTSPEETHAYTQFVAALCEMAKKQRRVVAKEKPADSEKFAFRCFLLRLGFIGEDYASARKILLRNLPGDSSFKSGKRGERDDAASVAANAADSGADALGGSSAGEGDLSAQVAEHARVEGDALAEALADAELIHNVNMLFEEEAVGDGCNV